ncbi:MAG: cysteine desulfurase [Clostridia bacterium]|nr:cysteine desulfurase [Clostridia bacterium]
MIYLDNSATTELSAAAKKRIGEVLDVYGNPSSKHALGVEARAIIDKARDQVGRAMGLSHPAPENLIFTSCGSESNCTAILGSLYSKEKRRANKVITTDSEHPAVENVMKRLEKDGFEVIRLSTRGGELDYNEYTSVLDDKVALVSLMLVNNETGAVYDVKKFFAAAKRVSADITTHCDAVQGFLKVPFNAKSLGADFISVSAHKIHGPKGVGALYISPEIIKLRKIVPYIIGGGQEGGFRSGTENIIGIAAFGAAAEEGFSEFSQNVAKMTSLRDLCCEKLSNTDARVNLPGSARAPHIVSVTLPSIKSETMLNFLSGKGICVSAGSACSSHSRNISSALVGFGLKAEEADTTIRVSVGKYNTEEEILTFCNALIEGMNTLVRIKR